MIVVFEQYCIFCIHVERFGMANIKKYCTELSVHVMNLDGCNLLYVGICGHV